MTLKESQEIKTFVKGNTKEDYKIAQEEFEKEYGLNGNDGKLHILMIAGDISGCGYVRIDLPSKYLNRLPYISVFPTVKITTELLEWAHILVWQRQHREDLIRIREIAKATGKINIFEIDDNLHEVPKSNPANFFYNRGVKSYYNMLDWMKNCKILTCTRSELGEYYCQKVGIPYVVLPNSLDFELVDEINKQQHVKNERLRMGWAGSSTHQEDLQIILYAITELQKEYDFDFVMFGWDGVDRYKIGNTLLPIKDYLKGVKKEYHPYVPIEQYMNTLKSLNLDIGLCPVVDNDFNNKGKSNIKWMEYSAFHIPTVVSKVSCYTDYVKHGETAFVAKREADWYKYIKLLIESSELRNKISEQAYNKVRTNYDMSKNVLLWSSLYTNLIPNGTQNMRPTSDSISTI